VPDEPDCFIGVNREIDVGERIEDFGRSGTRMEHPLLQGLVALVMDLERLGDPLDFDDGGHYNSDSKLP
jgi:hypothetical protein